MSGKTIWIIVIVVILAAVGWWWWSQSNPGAYQPTAEETSLPSGQNTSDASLNADLNAVGSDLNGLDSDSANADAGISAAEGAQ